MGSLFFGHDFGFYVYGRQVRMRRRGVEVMLDGLGWCCEVGGIWVLMHSVWENAKLSLPQLVSFHVMGALMPEVSTFTEGQKSDLSLLDVHINRTTTRKSNCLIIDIGFVIVC